MVAAKGQHAIVHLVWRAIYGITDNQKTLSSTFIRSAHSQRRILPLKASMLAKNDPVFESHLRRNAYDRQSI